MSGVPCDRRMKVKIKGNVYKTIVRPAMVYGAETWAVKKAHEKMEVAEMKMLRWMCGVTWLDKIRKEKIRRSTEVGEISKKVQERRIRWHGHLMRRDYENCQCDTCLVFLKYQSVLTCGRHWHLSLAFYLFQSFPPTYL